MKNKNVGVLIIGISVVIVIIILIFNAGMKSIVDQTCSHGPACTMYETIRTQTYISLAIVALIFFLGVFLIFSKPDEKIVIKKIKERLIKKKLDLSNLEDNEREIVKLIQDEGAVFQRTLMEKLNIGKVGITRLLDRLESKQIIERKRRGMNNIVVLKN